MAWIWGDNTLSPGEAQRWWLWWPNYPGFEVIGVRPNSPDDEIDISSPGMQTNPDGSTTYFLTIENIGSNAVRYSFTGETETNWIWGDNTLSPGEAQRWWLWWPNYPGLEIIGVRCITSGGEIDYSSPGMQSNGDGSATYFITVTNVSTIPIQYHFVGFAIC